MTPRKCYFPRLRKSGIYASSIIISRSTEFEVLTDLRPSQLLSLEAKQIKFDKCLNFSSRNCLFMYNMYIQQLAHNALNAKLQIANKTLDFPFWSPHTKHYRQRNSIHFKHLVLQIISQVDSLTFNVLQKSSLKWTHSLSMVLQHHLSSGLTHSQWSYVVIKILQYSISWKIRRPLQQTPCKTVSLITSKITNSYFVHHGFFTGGDFL